MMHLLPAGIFQPSSVMPDCLARDFSLWRNIQREYAEELLGHEEEYDGTGCPIEPSMVDSSTSWIRSHASSAAEKSPSSARCAARDLRPEAVQDPQGLGRIGCGLRQPQLATSERVETRANENLVRVPALANVPAPDALRRSWPRRQCH